MADKQQITVSQILTDLGNGLSRTEIKQKYSLNSNDMKKFFSHPKLKGRRTKKATSYELVDDTADVVQTAAPIQQQENLVPKKAIPKKKVAEEAKSEEIANTTEIPKEEEEEEVLTEQQTTAGSEIKEVSTPDDAVEQTEETEVKKSLW